MQSFGRGTPLEGEIRQGVNHSQHFWLCAHTFSLTGAPYEIRTPIRLFTRSSILCQVAEVVQRTGYVDEAENHPADTPGEIYDYNGRRRELGDQLRGTQFLRSRS